MSSFELSILSGICNVTQTTKQIVVYSILLTCQNTQKRKCPSQLKKLLKICFVGSLLHDHGDGAAFRRITFTTLCSVLTVCMKPPSLLIGIDRLPAW